jgi:hypothetical protein
MRIAQSSMRWQGQPRFVIENGFVRATENGEDWAGASGKGAFDLDLDAENRMPKALCCGMKHLVSARFFVDPNVPRKWIENWLVHNLRESIEDIRVNYLHRYQYQGTDYDEIAVWWNQDLGKLMSFMNMDMQQTLNDDIMGEWRRKGVRQPELEHVAERIKMAHGFCKDQSTSSQSSEGGRS